MYLKINNVFLLLVSIYFILIYTIELLGARVRTPFTESNEMHVKDELKDPVLLEDIIEVLKIYKLLQRMKNK